MNADGRGEGGGLRGRVRREGNDIPVVSTTKAKRVKGGYLQPYQSLACLHAASPSTAPGRTRHTVALIALAIVASRRPEGRGRSFPSFRSASLAIYSPYTTVVHLA